MTTPAGHDDELTSSAPGRVSRSRRTGVHRRVRRLLPQRLQLRHVGRPPAGDPRRPRLLARRRWGCCCSSAPSARSSRCRCRAWSSSGSAPRRTVLTFACLNARGLIVASVGVALGEVLVVGFGLVMFGIGTGVWDASMNVEGAVVEQHLGRTVMPRYHAGFSFGTVAAAGIAAVAAGAARAGRRARPGRRGRCRSSASRSRSGAFLPIVDEPEVHARADAPGEGRPRRARRLARAAHAAHRPRRARRGAHRGVRERLGQPRRRRRLRRRGRASARSRSGSSSPR